MKILITGGTGFIGNKLTTRLLDLGHEIHILSRDKEKAKKIFPQNSVTVFEWKNNLERPPVAAISGINGVINLMGENIAAKRWSKEQKKILKESRIDSTLNLIAQIEENLNSPLDFFISASAIGIYPVNLPKALSEDSILGHGYLAELCKMWEGACERLTKTKRKVIVRTGIVLEKDGGALKKMLPPFLMGLGGPIGDGNQMMSWIEFDDLVNIYIKAATDQSFSGIYNGVAPTPVSNFDFTKALGSAINRPTIFPIPALPLKIAFGEMSTILLDSQVVIPKRLLASGFKFQFETIDAAFLHLFRK